MRIQLNLPDDDIAFLDDYVARHPGSRRSSARRDAIRLLREEELGEQYQAALSEWHESGEDRVWDSVAGHGIEPEHWEALESSLPLPTRLPSAARRNAGSTDRGNDLPQ